MLWFEWHGVRMDQSINFENVLACHQRDFQLEITLLCYYMLIIGAFCDEQQNKTVQHVRQ